MSLTTAIQNDINAYIRNYAVSAFHDMRLNSILLRICQQLDGISGGVVTNPPAIQVTQVNFTSATDCPIPSLNGHSLAIFWNDANRFLIPGTDFTPYVGGGFTILIPGFDATSINVFMTIFTTS